MKKVYILFVFVIFSVVLTGLLGKPIGAQETLYAVNYNASFDDSNIGVSYSGDHPYADRISFDTDIEDLTDYTFAFWIVNGIVRYDLEYNHSFIVNGDMTMEAVFSDDVKFAVVFMDSNGDRIGLEYVPSGSDATPPSTLPDKPGFVVNSPGTEWSDSHQGVLEHKVLYLQYTIDETTQYDITVNGGSGDGTYTYNDVVSVVADEAPESEVFSHWEVDGETVSFEETYQFSAFEDKTLTAVYAQQAPVVTPLITMSDDLEIRTGHSTYRGQFSFDQADYELIEYGFLRSDTEASPEHSMQDVTRYRGVKHHGQTREFIMSFADPMVYQRPYLVLEDNSGVLHYYYGNVVETANYDVSLTANNASATVNVVQNPPYFEGDIVDITASDVTDHEFMHWYDLDTNSVYSTISSDSLEVTRNYNLEARYEYVDPDEVLYEDFTGAHSVPSGWTFSANTYSPEGYPRLIVENAVTLTTESFNQISSGTVTIEYVGNNLGVYGDDEDISIGGSGGDYYVFGATARNGTHTITANINSPTTSIIIEAYAMWDLSDGSVDIVSIEVRTD